MFNLASFIYLNQNDNDKIKSKGILPLKKSFIFFKTHLPRIFKYEIDWCVKAFPPG